MCLPSSWDTMTRQERLAGAEAMRAHHKALFDAYVDSVGVEAERIAKAAMDDHTKEHNKAVRQRREAQKERVK